MADKTGAKSGPRPGTFRAGADPRRGHGLPGRSGRKPIEFKAECSDLTDAEVLPRIREYLRTADPSDQGWRWAADWLANYGKGRPVQAVDTTITERRVIVENGPDLTK